MRQPDGLRASGPKKWSWTHGTTRRRSDERVNIPQTGYSGPRRPLPHGEPIALAGHRSGPFAALSGSSYVYLCINRALLPLMPDGATPPLPRSRSVVVEVTKIVDIDRP